MHVFDAMQSTLERYVSPIAEKLNENQAIQSLTRGMMGTMPIMLGVCLLSIIVNLPIEPLSAFLASSGLADAANGVLTVTMNMLALYVCVSISYTYAKMKGENGICTAMLTLGIFMVMVPLVVQVEGRSSISLINTSYLGSQGIFVAIALSLLVVSLYSFLMKRMKIKLPESIPTMVSDSLSPTFVAIVMFTLALLVKWGFTFTPWGNLFDCVNALVATPIMNIGTSPVSFILVYTIACFFWFFGIHPTAILNVYSPVLSASLIANIEAYTSGTPSALLPFLIISVLRVCVNIGGSGEGIGLALCSLTAKSERYKALSKVAIVPALFNISEPLMFGMPVVMNPTFFIPMVFVQPICLLAAWGMTALGFANALNPAASTPWVVPNLISSFIAGGFGFAAMILVIIVLATLLWYPFFKVADNQALREEAEAIAASEEA